MPISSCLDERLMPKVGPDPSATSVPVHGAGFPRAATSYMIGQTRYTHVTSLWAQHYQSIFHALIVSRR
jgi:hypothetical protein